MPLPSLRAERSNPLLLSSLRAKAKQSIIKDRWIATKKLKFFLAMTKNVVLIIVDSLYFFCHSRESLSGIYKIIYYSSVIPAKQLSGNLLNNKHPFFCRCRHCERKWSNPLLLSSLRAKAKQSSRCRLCYCLKFLFFVIPECLYRESIKK